MIKSRGEYILGIIRKADPVDDEYAVEWITDYWDGLFDIFNACDIKEFKKNLSKYEHTLV